MKVESANIPALRFAGYSSQTKTHELGKVTKVIDCKHRTPEYVKEGVPIVSPGSIKWGEIDLVTPTKRVTDHDYESLMDHCEPQVGDLVLSRNQSLGIASYITSGEKFVLGQDTVLIQQKKGNGMLIFHRLQTSATQNLIRRLSGGSTFSRINLKDIRLLPLALPIEEGEQRKIADFLTAVDGRIGQLIQKRALLEDYKKGVMQALFTQAIRFKDDHGNDFPDWEEKKLGDLFEITSSKRVFQSEWQDEGVPFYRAREIIKIGANGWVDNDLFISHKMFEEYEAKYGAPQKDDLLVTGVGTIGKVYRVPEGSKFYFKDGNIVWLKASDKVDSSFIEQLFKSRLVQKQITDGAAITTVATFTIIAAKNLKIPFPDRTEQTIIAKFLFAIDRKIESVSTQITETQTFKRGLLQQMFV